MIVIACLHCNVAIRTVGDEAEVYQLVGHGSEWYPDKYPCPTAGCPGLAQYLEAIDPNAARQLVIHDVTPQEAFAAIEGLGFPVERDCSETAVRQVFEHKITKTGVRQVRNSNRSIIDWIEFDNGVRMYLAASSDGAVVYRLAGQHSYVEQNGG